MKKVGLWRIKNLMTLMIFKSDNIDIDDFGNFGNSNDSKDPNDFDRLFLGKIF